jgi:hypothetical protein
MRVMIKIWTYLQTWAQARAMRDIMLYKYRHRKNR